MTHKLTFLERIRRDVFSIVHGPLSILGLYAERSTPHDQYALTVYEPLSVIEIKLHHLGLVRNLLSSVKYREYVTPSEVSVASWVLFHEGALRSHYQLHLDLYIGPDEMTTDVYAHWEPSWVRHPITHYRGQQVDAAAGVEMSRDLFEDTDLEWSIKPDEQRYKRVDEDEHMEPS